MVRSTLTRFVFQIPQNQRKWTESWFVSFLWRCLLLQWLTRRRRRKRGHDNGYGAGGNEILRFVNGGLNYWKVVCVLGPIDTTPEEFEKGVLTPRMHQKFFVHLTPEEFKNAKIIGHFGFVSVWRNISQGNHMISVQWCYHFWEDLFSKHFFP